jgi:hypothetical protein
VSDLKVGKIAQFADSVDDRFPVSLEGSFTRVYPSADLRSYYVDPRTTSS